MPGCFMQIMTYHLHVFMILSTLCTFAGYWHIFLSEEDSTLAHGGVFQHVRCVSVQRIRAVDGGESKMEAGEMFQEEAIPGRVGESHASTLHSTTPTPSPNASLCRIGERDTRRRSEITCCKRERWQKEEVQSMCAKRCKNKHDVPKMQCICVQGTCNNLHILSKMCMRSLSQPTPSLEAWFLTFFSCFSVIRQKQIW